MADVFGHFGLATGNNDGTSWEDAYQTPAAFTAGLSTDDVGLVKKDKGYIMSAAFTVAVNCTIHFGFASTLTGTSYDIGARTDVTKLNGNDGAYRALDLSANVTITRLEVYNYSFATAPIGNFTSGVLEFSDCVFRGSVSTGSDDVSGMRVADPAELTLTNCLLHDLTGGAFGALRIEYAAVTISGCSIYDNEGSFGAGLAIYASGSETITIEDTLLATNVGALGGAVFDLGSDGPVIFNRCRLINNTASYGAAIYIDSGGGAITINNCVIADNNSNYSGAVRFDSSSGYLNITQSIIANNDSTDTVCGGVDTNQDPYIADCILWGNTGTAGSGSQLLSADTAGVAEYCDIEYLASTGVSGIASISNCVDADPLFIGTGDDPYNFTGSSPTSVTEGGSVSVTGYQDYDILSVDRPGSDPSMGAYQVAAASTNPCSISITVSAQEWSAAGSQANDASLGITVTAQRWFAQGSQENAAALAIEAASQEWAAAGSQANDAAIAIEIGAQQWEAVAAQAGTNACTINIEVPAQEWTAAGSQANDASIAIEIASVEMSAVGAQYNTASVTVEVAPQEWAATGSQENQAALSIELPAQEWSMYGSSPTNPCTIAVQVAPQLWSASGSQANSAVLSAVVGPQIWTAAAGVVLPEDAFNPTLDVKMDALQRALEWAFGCRIRFGRSPEGNEYEPYGSVWGDLVLMFAGDAENCDVEIRDVDIAAYDGVTPRQEVAIRQTQLRFQLTLRSRSQKPSKSAWATGLTGMSRVKLPWFIEEFLTPYNLAIGEFRQLTDSGFTYDNRVEDMAIFEILVYTVMVECDEAARGTWIERVEVTSNLGLPSSLEWSDETIPEEE
jgi:hypothetical protein